MMRRVLFACCLIPALQAHALELDPDEMVTAHNRWRATVGAAPLAYSHELAASAQEWANRLKRTNRCRMRHSLPEGRYGENLYWASAVEWSDGKREVQQISAKKVVDDWAGERMHFDYRNNRCAKGKMCGHYTQVVWRTTTMVGCAVAVCEDTREQVWVCRYQPAGNWVGERPY